jgi:hypothetical protein
MEVAQYVGAEQYERGIERSGERNGYRDRTWDTRVGSIELRVPRVRDGGYYPALLEPRGSESRRSWPYGSVWRYSTAVRCSGMGMDPSRSRAIDRTTSRISSAGSGARITITAGSGACISAGIRSIRSVRAASAL